MLQLGGESPGLPLPVELVEKDSPCRGESGASLRTEHGRWESSPRAEHRACALSTLPERNLSFSLVLGTAAREVDEAAAGHLDLHHSSCWAPTPMHPSAAKPNTHQLSKWFYLFFFFFLLGTEWLLHVLGAIFGRCSVSLYFPIFVGFVDAMECFLNHKSTTQRSCFVPYGKILI